MQKYTKAIVALVAAVAAAVATGLGNGNLGDINGSDWVWIALAVVGSPAAVWFAENGPAAPAIKAILAAFGAGLTALTVAYANDGVISQGEWLTAAAAFLGALTVAYQLQNKNV